MRVFLVVLTVLAAVAFAEEDASNSTVTESLINDVTDGNETEVAHYKLSYFDMRNRAEVARQLFALADVEYEDYRFKKGEWPTVKPSAPFNHAPYLQIDGGPKLGQSMTINRYLAKKFGFGGRSDWETDEIESLADQYSDHKAEFQPFFVIMAGYDKKSDKEKMQKEVGVPSLNKFFRYVKPYLAESKSGFLIGDQLSWVDLLIADHVETIENLFPSALEKFPELLVHKKKIHEIPAIKKWIEKRPVTAT